MANKLTGKAGSLTWNSVVIAFKVVKSKFNRELADTTDSLDYDSGSDLVWPSQLAVKGGVELSIEGNFNLSTTPPNFIAIACAGGAALPAVVKASPSVTLLHGNFDLSDFECDEPVDDTVTFTATLKSNGVVTPNA